jgi:hypothetical protein
MDDPVNVWLPSTSPRPRAREVSIARNTRAARRFADMAGGMEFAAPWKRDPFTARLHRRLREAAREK